MSQVIIHQTDVDITISGFTDIFEAIGYYRDHKILDVYISWRDSNEIISRKI